MATASCTIQCILFVLLCCRDRVQARQERKCPVLFMCPPFCMKVKDGCYVCDCGSLSGYMDKMSKEVLDVANKKLSQTGSQLASKLQSTINGNDVLYGQAQSWQRNGGNWAGGSPSRSGLNINFDLHNMKQADFMPDFTQYYQPFRGRMPGMNCPPRPFDCPTVCTKTDVYTGCVRCTCDGNESKVRTTIKPSVNHSQTTTATETTPVSLLSTTSHSQSSSTVVTKQTTSNYMVTMPTTLRRYTDLAIKNETSEPPQTTSISTSSGQSTTIPSSTFASTVKGAKTSAITGSSYPATEIDSTNKGSSTQRQTTLTVTSKPQGLPFLNTNYTNKLFEMGSLTQSSLQMGTTSPGINAETVPSTEFSSYYKPSQENITEILDLPGSSVSPGEKATHQPTKAGPFFQRQCPPFKCNEFCIYGYQVRNDLCPACKCREKPLDDPSTTTLSSSINAAISTTVTPHASVPVPTIYGVRCQPIICNMDCTGRGFVLDSTGCPKCLCRL